jgi:hypothetical protein
MTDPARLAGASPAPARSDAGVSLVVTVFGIVLLTVLGFGLTSLGTMATISTVNERDSAEAWAIADAGIAHARKLMLWQEWPSLNLFLQNGNGTACDGDELSGPPAGPLPAGYPTAPSAFIPAAGQPFGRGSYQVFVCDDHLTDRDVVTGVLDVNPNADVNRRVLVRAVATGADGSTASSELVMGAQDLPAVIVNGPLKVSGHPQVTGNGGTIHANGGLELAGDPCASMFYSSVETVTVSGSSVGSGATCSNANLDTRPDSTPLPLPLLHPDQFKTQATFWLEADGTIYDGQTGAVIPNLPGWTFSKGQFSWNAGTNIPAGTYWINANVALTGSPGSTGTPLPLTLMARYSIDVSGSPDTQPHLTVSGPGMMPTGLSMLAGTDLELTGSYTQVFNSLYYAAHQVDIAGTPVINGQVLAANLADTTYPPGNMNLVELNSSGQMDITGTPTINFNGNGLVATVPMSWRECRGLNPADPCGPLWGGP